MNLKSLNIELSSLFGAEHAKQSLILLDEALSGLDYDVAQAMLCLYAKSPDTVDNDSRFSFIYDSAKSKRFNVSRIYNWNYKSKLWEVYDDDECRFKNYYFDMFIKLLENLQIILNTKMDKDLSHQEKVYIDSTISRVAKVIRKCKTRSSISTIWMSIKDMISVNFSYHCNNMSKELPFNDGTLYNMESKERRPRTVNDFYTYTVVTAIVNGASVYYSEERLYELEREAKKKRTVHDNTYHCGLCLDVIKISNSAQSQNKTYL